MVPYSTVHRSLQPLLCKTHLFYDPFDGVVDVVDAVLVAGIAASLDSF